jgi:hypothetical protein
MSLRKPVTDSDGVKFEWNPAAQQHSCFYGFSQSPQVHVAGVHFVKRVSDADEGSAHIFVDKTYAAKMSSVSCAIDPVYQLAASQI